MASGPPQPASKHTLEKFIEGVLFGAGGIATVVALGQFYGGAATFLILGGVTLLLAVHMIMRSDGFAWRTFLLSIWQDRVVFFVMMIGALFITAGLLAAWGGWMRVTFGRASFTEKNYVLPVAKLNSAQNEFGVQPGSTHPGELAKQDKDSKQEWLRWMAKTFSEPTEDLDGKDVYTSLVYIESDKFDDKYDSFHAWIEVDATVAKIGRPVAFLVEEGSKGVWYKPRFRQLDVIMVGEDDTTPLIRVEKPEKDERLVLFLPVKNKTNPDQLPDLRQCFPNQHHLEVK